MSAAYAERALRRAEEAAACGCGGKVHPEHEVCDLILDMQDWANRTQPRLWAPIVLDITCYVTGCSWERVQDGYCVRHDMLELAEFDELDDANQPARGVA